MKLKTKGESSSSQDNTTSASIATSELFTIQIPSIISSVSSTSSISSAEDQSAGPQLMFLHNHTRSHDGRIVVVGKPMDYLADNAAHSNFGNTPSVGEKRTRTVTSECLSPRGIPSIVSLAPEESEGQRIAKKMKMYRASAPLPSVQFDPILLLTRPEDADNLNPIHCFVRRNIECFVATEEDITAPCPGRKNALRPGQVGLRCVHCRNVKSRERTKRAVCYPSSINRVYNCVSDMKFDHFSHCKFLPEVEREAFNELKAKRGSNARGKGGNNTARYYYDSAVKIGMTEMPDGIVMLTKTVAAKMPLQPAAFPIAPSPVQFTTMPIVQNLITGQVNVQAPFQMAPSPMCTPVQEATRINSHNTYNLSYPTTIHPDRRPLASSRDEEILNPIHCFVRKNVEVFIANAEDVSAPAPGRKKRITLGQVGIRCIHCKSLPPKYRVKRAICYPPTIASLYHAVSNMKFDHYGACKGLSPTARQHFTDLKSSSSRKISADVSRTVASCTARYYKESAQRELGLIDTDAGIRVATNTFLDTGIIFHPSIATIAPRPNNPPSVVSTAKQNVGVSSNERPMDGMSALMLAATDSHMRQEYEERKLKFTAGV